MTLYKYIIIKKKYFGLVSRLEYYPDNNSLYHISYGYKPKDILGLHIFFFKIYFSLYIRIGKKK